MYFDHENLKNPNSLDLGYIMYIFSAFMLIVAVIAWLYIPRVQERETEQANNLCIPSSIVINKTLEDLAEGREGEVREDRVGVKERVGALRKRLRAKYQE